MKTIEYRTEQGIDTLVIGAGPLLYARHDGALFMLQGDNMTQWQEIAPLPNSDRAEELLWMIEPAETDSPLEGPWSEAEEEQEQEDEAV